MHAAWAQCTSPNQPQSLGLTLTRGWPKPCTTYYKREEINHTFGRQRQSSNLPVGKWPLSFRHKDTNLPCLQSSSWNSYGSSHLDTWLATEQTMISDCRQKKAQVATTACVNNLFCLQHIWHFKVHQIRHDSQSYSPLGLEIHHGSVSLYNSTRWKSQYYYKCCCFT